MSDKVDLSELKGNYLLERFAVSESKDVEWPALAQAFGWNAPDDPRWMTEAERRNFWAVASYAYPVRWAHQPSRVARIITAIGRLTARRRA